MSAQSPSPHILTPPSALPANSLHSISASSAPALLQATPPFLDFPLSLTGHLDSSLLSPSLSSNIA